MDIPIVNKSITPTFTFDKLTLNSMIVSPFKNARLFLQLHFIDESATLPPDMCYVNRTIEMTHEEYENWTTDDYIMQFILSKLNLTNTETIVPKLNPEIKTAINKLRLK